VPGADGGITLTGDWGEASRIASTMQSKFARALDRAVMREAHYLRSLMVKGIVSGAPGGNPFKPLSPMTLALRSAGGFGGTKPLIRTGALRGSITVIKVGGGRVFVGVSRSARSADGKSLANIASIMEHGGTTTHTLRQRRYLMAKLREAGIDIAKFGRGPLTRDAKGRYQRGQTTGSGVPIGSQIQIPARPFIGPILRVYAKPVDVRARFYASIAADMGGDFGKAASGKL
jgi:hypothetical protein